MGTDMIGLSGPQHEIFTIHEKESATSTQDVLVDDDTVFDGLCGVDVADDEPSSGLNSFRHGALGHCIELEDSLIQAVGDFRELVGLGTLDLLEVCAPWDSPLSQAVRSEGGRAMSIGLHNGYDLKTVAGFKAALALLRKTKPRYLHISPPCDPWTAIQNCNQRTEEQINRLQFKRSESRKLLNTVNVWLKCNFLS